MTRKEKLLIEVYRLKNRIAEFKGEKQTDIEEYSKHRPFKDEACNDTMCGLEFKIETLEKSYEKIVEEKHIADAREAYYATTEGAAHKTLLEKAIEEKIAEWKEMDRETSDAIECRLQQLMGVHWNIKRLDKGHLTIGIIDAENTTPERREFFFGQEINIRYEEHYYLFSDKERFECNCGACGSFAMDGGTTISEQAMFYVGIGKLFGDAATVEWLRITMRGYNRSSDKLSGELESLRAELENPMKKEEA